MDRLVIVIGILLAAALLILVAQPGPQRPSGVEGPQSWTVLVGKEAQDGALQALRFLPEKIAIHVGDSVTWKINAQEEHTIYFTAGGPLPGIELMGPDGREYFNPAVFFPSEEGSYDGRRPLSGGVLASNEEDGSKIFTLTFTRPGTYEYVCMFHPGMKGTVIVLPVDQPLPYTPSYYARTARSEANLALERAEKLHQQLLDPQVTPRPDGTNEYMLDMVGDRQTMATVVRFEPETLRIKVGDTVTWRMLDYTNYHTVTFLENPEEEPELALVEPQDNGPPLLVVNPMAWHPAGGNTYAGSGYFNSGALFRPEGQAAPTYSLTFTKPGTYEYICILHEYLGMKGTIIVEPAKTVEAKEPPTLAIVDYTSQTGKPGEADGIAIVDLNPHSTTFGKVFQQVSIGEGVSPHHLYYNRDGSRLYTTALGGARLYRIDMMGDRIHQVTPIDAGPCQVGEDLYFTEDGSKFYLTCMGSSMVLVFDAHTEKLIGQIQAPAPHKPYVKYPHGIAVDESIDRMIVTETVSPALDDPGASVSVIELSTGKVLSTHSITKDGQGGTAPVEVMFLPGQHVAYVTAMFEGTLWAGMYDAYTKDFRFQMVDDLTARGQGVPLEMYVGPDGDLYVSFGVPGGVNVYDISNPMAPKLLKTLPADAGAHHIAFSKDGKQMFVQNNLLNLEKMNAGTISVVNLESGQLAATVDTLVKQGLQPASLVLLGQAYQHGGSMMPMMPAPAMGFTLHIDAKKHINELPEFVVHHYCKNIDPQVIQCLLFDSDAPNAHVIGVETIISPAIYNQLPQEERASWHYHKDEIPLVDAKLPGLSEAQIQQVVAALENTYGRVVIFWVPGTPAPMGIPSVVNPQSGHPTETTVSIPPEIPAITIKANDYAFEASDEISAGPVSIILENDGAEPHHVQLARVKDGVTMNDVQDALRQGPESALFDLLEWAGGASVVMPRGRQQVLLDLREGQYVLLCFVASPDGVPHFAKGMVKFVNVVSRGGPQRANLQNLKSSNSVKLRDFSFQIPETIQAGPQVWTVTNEGVQPHEITLIQLAPGKTVQDAMNFMQSESPQGPPPFEFAGGMQALATAKTGWVMLNLTPGMYVALCFVPDPQSGKPHVELGMIQAFTVGSGSVPIGSGMVRQMIERSGVEFAMAVNQGNSASIAAFYADNARLLPPGAPMIEGRQNLQAFWQSFIDTTVSRRLDLKPLEIKVQGNLAYETGTYMFQFQLQDQSQMVTETGKYVTLWERQADGSWKIIVDTWNTDSMP